MFVVLLSGSILEENKYPDAIAGVQWRIDVEKDRSRVGVGYSFILLSITAHNNSNSRFLEPLSVEKLVQPKPHFSSIRTKTIF